MQLLITNNASPALHDYAPIEVFLGRQHRKPLALILDTDAHDVCSILTDKPDIHAVVSRLMTHLAHVHSNIQKHPQRPNRHVPGELEPDFGIGDWVLISCAATDRWPDKTRPIWYGPARVTSINHDCSFTVYDLNTERTLTVHARFLKWYADGSLSVSPQLQEFAAHAGAGYQVSHILDIGKRSGAWKVLVRWEHFGPEHDTWEPFETIAEDIPVMLRTFIRTLSDSTLRDQLLAEVARIARAKSS